jgi:hypothetical protein
MMYSRLTGKLQSVYEYLRASTKYQRRLLDRILEIQYHTHFVHCLSPSPSLSYNLIFNPTADILGSRPGFVTHDSRFG